MILLLAGCGGEAFSDDGELLEQDGGEWIGVAETGGVGGDETGGAAGTPEGAGGTHAAGTSGSGGAAPAGGAPTATGGVSTGGREQTGGAAGDGAAGDAGAPSGGAGGAPACADGEKRCSDDSTIERCDRGVWIPHTLCTQAPHECRDGRCTTCSTDGVKSEALVAQCIDGIWSGCVSNEISPTFEELCTQIEVTRWVDGSWALVWISAIPTP